MGGLHLGRRRNPPKAAILIHAMHGRTARSQVRRGLLRMLGARMHRQESVVEESESGAADLNAMGAPA
jgi:hypothetical protein